MYQGDCCHVKLPDRITPPFKPDIGIKQGDGLSPLLFSIFLDDIVEHAKSTTDAPQLANQYPANKIILLEYYYNIIFCCV